MKTAKKTLVCPLNWGLGHATRCVPLIRKELEEGNEVVIASDGFPLKFLKQQFPDLRFVEFPSYPVKYSKTNSQIFAFIKFLPKMFRDIHLEHEWLRELNKTEHFDRIISDNRFGLWSRDIHSIYITHQVMIKMPKGLKSLEKIGYLLHRRFIQNYNECWIPDYPENGGLSGDLAHKYPTPQNAKYIGMLSRFDIYNNVKPNTKYDNVVILSGVEPQRTIFQEAMTKEYENSHQKTLMLIGKPTESLENNQLGNITILPHLEDDKMAAVFKGAKNIVCRAGYSTVMDLEVLDCLNKAEFYPTPGQTEQEYLAEYLENKKAKL